MKRSGSASWPSAFVGLAAVLTDAYRLGMDDEQQNDSSAAAALLAHFNYQLAERLVERLLKEKSSSVWKGLANAVIRGVAEYLPEAMKTVLWPRLERAVSDRVTIHCSSAEFDKRVTEAVDGYVATWLHGAMDKALEAAARQQVVTAVSCAAGHDSRTKLNYSADLQKRFGMLVTQALERAASERVAEATKPR